MKATDAGFVALRFLGLWFVLAGLVGIPGSLSWLTWGGEIAIETRLLSLGLTLAHLVIVVLAGYVFVNAWKVSRFLFGSADDLELTSPAGSLQAVAFSVVGAVFVMGAIPALMTNVVNFVWVLRKGGDVEREAFFSSPTFFEVLYSVVSLALGAFVLVRSRWLVERWEGFQERAADKTSPVDEEDLPE